MYVTEIKHEGTRINFYHPQHYELRRLLGSGAYGTVVSALDKKTDKMVAIKRINQVTMDGDGGARVHREIKLMQHFDHENITSALTTYEVPAKDEIYIVMDYMETDLHCVIRSKQPLYAIHVQYVMFQMVKALRHIHDTGVMHRDIKPSNVLINEDCSIKIADFGLSRSCLDYKKNQDQKYTEYAVTRWYRAPEIMCASCRYDTKVDIWSLGCIFGEMYGRSPMFRGADYIDQLELIIKVVGTPSKSDMDDLSNPRAIEYIKSMPYSSGVPLRLVYSNAPAIAIDLMEQMLTFNPKKRITASEAYYHPFFDDMRQYDGDDVVKPPKLFQ